MKKVSGTSIAAIALSLILISCSHNTSNTSNSPNNKVSNTDISVETPMTISNNNLFPINGKKQYLRLKMVKGKYYEDWNPGGISGTIWDGDFIIELDDDAGNTISKTDLSKIYNGPLTFTSFFQLQFDDYNNDGDLDFTIGQHGSSNGNIYRLFTLRKDGKIDELPVKGHPSLFISKASGAYSTKLTKVGDASFKIAYYDNSKSKNMETTFKWDGKEFIQFNTTPSDTASKFPSFSGFKDTIGTNQWNTTINGTKVYVYAGANKSNPKQGLITVAKDVASQVLHSYPTPTQHGSVKIIKADDTKLTLQATDGTKFTFDLNTRTYSK